MSEIDEDIQKFKIECQKHSKKISNELHQNVIINPNDKIVYNVIRMILKNEKKYGFKFCPCKPDTFKKKNENEEYISVCPCINHKNELLKDKKCCCNLYVIR